MNREALQNLEGSLSNPHPVNRTWIFSGRNFWNHHLELSSELLDRAYGPPQSVARKKSIVVDLREARCRLSGPEWGDFVVTIRICAMRAFHVIIWNVPALLEFIRLFSPLWTTDWCESELEEILGALPTDDAPELPPFQSTGN